MSKYEKFDDSSERDEVTAHEIDDEPLLAGPHSTSFQTPGAPQDGGHDVMVGASAPEPGYHQPYLPYPGSGGPGSGYPPGPYLTQPVPSSSTNTTVIVQQPFQMHPQSPRQWSSRICECGRDWSICCCGLFCLCCLESRVVEDMGESCLLPCCVPGWLITLRTKMRLQENIEGSVLDDCCVVCCCGACALCQLAYEIKVVKEARMMRTTAMRPI